MKAVFQRLISTPARLTVFVAMVYFISSFFSVSIRTIDPLPGDNTLYFKKNHWVTVSMPRVLRGDEMHYLMMAHSLANDGDLRLSREYNSVQHGGIEMGIYHRGRPADEFFQHFARDTGFTLLARHSFGLSAVLAMLLWPWAGTSGMEAGAIWVTVFWGSLGVLVFVRVLEMLNVAWPRARNAALLLAFATPWFSYSRTLYTEVYIGTGMLIVMLAVLKNRTLWALPLMMATGWFKYPALALFAGAAGGESLYRRWRNVAICGVVGIVTMLCIYGFYRDFFRDATWFTSQKTLTSAIATSVEQPASHVTWVPGKTFNNIKRLFLDFDKGLFPHCPILLIACGGIVIMARRNRRMFWLVLAMALPWTLLHITYRHLMAGDSYTTRYLVPVIPFAMIGMPWFREWAAGRRCWRMAAMLLIALSLINNIIAGFLPALTFDKTPWEVAGQFMGIVRAAGIAFGTILIN